MRTPFLLQRATAIDRLLPSSRALSFAAPLHSRLVPPTVRLSNRPYTGVCRLTPHLGRWASFGDSTFSAAHPRVFSSTSMGGSPWNPKQPRAPPPRRDDDDEDSSPTERDRAAADEAKGLRAEVARARGAAAAADEELRSTEDALLEMVNERNDLLRELQEQACALGLGFRV